MNTLSHIDRAAALESMAADGIDVLVIGGGITGAAVAYEAAVAGFTVGLVEKGDYASGTSSKSTKLAHGGIRYLPQMDFALVHEALVERGRLFHNAPWLVKPIEFVLPLYDWSKKPLGVPFAPPGGAGLPAMVDGGLELYDTLAGRLNVHHHSRLSVDDVVARAPSLSLQGLRTAFAYFDGRTDDVRLTLANLRSALAGGAKLANYASVIGFETSDGAITTALVQDLLTGADYAIRARHIVNATGVHAAAIEALTGMPSQIAISAAKGVHLLVSANRLPVTDAALVLPETDDGRLMFIIPWRGAVLIGTTDTEGGDVDSPATTRDDVRYLLDHCNRYLTPQLTEADVISTMAGYRPLITRTGKSSRRLSRSHLLHDGPCGMVTITGGKLTTSRIMAEQTVAHIARRDGRRFRSGTRDRVLDGGERWPLDWDALAARYPIGDLTADAREHIAESYGGNTPELLRLFSESSAFALPLDRLLPYVAGEVVYACRYEGAQTLEDVLERRTRIALESHDHGTGIAPTVAAIMATELNWDENLAQREVGTFAANCRVRYGVAE
ncbi:MAG TPA: glycerol-3-phosphate dehydrogenase/oxidase [Capsulimonadaceae bacterium]